MGGVVGWFVFDGSFLAALCCLQEAGGEQVSKTDLESSQSLVSHEAEASLVLFALLFECVACLVSVVAALYCPKCAVVLEPVWAASQQCLVVGSSVTSLWGLVY